MARDVDVRGGDGVGDDVEHVDDGVEGQEVDGGGAGEGEGGEGEAGEGGEGEDAEGGADQQEGQALAETREGAARVESGTKR